MNSLLIFTIAIVLTSVLSGLAVKKLIQYLLSRNIVDVANERSMHDGEVPRGGGLVIFFAAIVAAILMALISHRTLFFSAIIGYLSGWALLSWCDDRRDLSPLLRFPVQLILSAFAVAAFGWVDRLYGFDLGILGPILCVLGITWLANLNNFMDGMDGLAASQAIISLLTFAVWFYFLGDQHLALMCAIVAAACYGFLISNWHPAKVFMGDVGSITLGAFYGLLIIIAFTRYDVPVLSSLMVVSLFVFDASVTLVRRAFNKEKIWLPHRSHFYQRAAALGIDHEKIVLCSIAIMTLCSLLATLTVLYRDTITSNLVFVILLMTAISGWITLKESRQTN